MCSPYFSIIVPVYNVKLFLRQCLNSILEQDYSDYEVILVNDASTDDSGQICDEYVKNDLHFKVIHKGKNEGIANVRNSGISEAKGQYLWFLDSDDYFIDKSAFTKVVTLFQKTNADFVLFSYKKYYEKTKIYSNSILNPLSEKTNKRELVKTNAFKSLSWNKIVKHSFVKNHNMQYPKGQRYSEDLPWCADLLVLSDNIAFLSDNLVAYRQHNESFSNTKIRQLQERLICETLLSIEDTVSKYNVGNINNSNVELVGSFLAYEYSWFLSFCFPFWSKYSKRIKALSFLMDYTLNEKAAKVARLKQILGLYGASFILWLFTQFRNN